MSDLDLRQVRAARNQSVFRDVNARLIELNETFELLTEASTFVCECFDLGCVEQIEMSLSDYHRIRTDPRRFFVAPSDAHVVPEAETIVERTDTYFVVEKFGAAIPIVEATAPPDAPAPS